MLCIDREFYRKISLFVIHRLPIAFDCQHWAFIILSSFISNLFKLGVPNVIRSTCRQCYVNIMAHRVRDILTITKKGLPFPFLKPIQFRCTAEAETHKKNRKAIFLGFCLENSSELYFFCFVSSFSLVELGESIPSMENMFTFRSVSTLFSLTISDYPLAQTIIIGKTCKNNHSS